MKRNLLQLLVLLLWPACMMMAQNNINMKFGKPTKEEMQMTVYDADPNAEAVVLCRLTDVEYTIQQTGYLVDYREKVRIKVLKPSGARFATEAEWCPFRKGCHPFSEGDTDGQQFQQL